VDKVACFSVCRVALLLGIAKDESDNNLALALDYATNPDYYADGRTVFSLDHTQLVAPNGTRNALLAITAHLIKQNLLDTSGTVRPDFDARTVESTLEFTTLIDVIWWHLLKLAESRDLKLCPECRSVFPATRSNQVYCPPPTYFSSTSSLCRARHKTRTYRTSQRDKE